MHFQCSKLINRIFVDSLTNVRSMVKQNQVVKLVATDLDGTFLMNDKSVSNDNLKSLHALGERGILRVIATGRNLKKALDVIPEHIPFDYIVFSSGAGVYDRRNDKLLFYQNLSAEVAQALSDFLIANDLNFHLFKPVPQNYMCWYHRGSILCQEFENYFTYLQAHSEPLPISGPINSEACQFLVVFPNDLDRFMKLKNEIESKFEDVKVVRTSSPLESGYIWMEIFHQTVSKGNGVRFLCDSLQIDHKHTVGIGNDYNDLDLLEFTNHSYLVANGPDELKMRFLPAKSNEESAFASIVENYL